MKLKNINKVVYEIEGVITNSKFKGKTIKFIHDPTKEIKLSSLVKFTVTNVTPKVSGEYCFFFTQTHGLNLNTIKKVVKKKGMEVDIEGYEKESEKHKKVSKISIQTKFGGRKN